METNITDIFKNVNKSPEARAHLIQRITDLAIEIQLLESEKERLEERL